VSKANCGQCGCLYKVSHFNSKYCQTCRQLRRKKNLGLPAFADEKTIENVLSLVGTKLAREVASDLGMSVASLKRITKTLGVSAKKITVTESQITEVRAYYLKHGRPATEQRFPNIKVRTIIERYGWVKGECPRQRRWKDSELIELAKFAGLVSYENQANFFNRPRAHAGSIKSAWTKKFKTHPGFMHGIPLHKAKIFLDPGFPTIQVQNSMIDVGGKKMVLFCDAVEYIAKDCPVFVRDAIKAMAEFQEKLFGKNPRLHIENILTGMDYAN
jgi:hypothetical protein